MNVRAWLETRTPEPPAALQARLDELLNDSLEDDSANIPATFVARASVLVETMLATGTTGRESALDLLAADALVTYAFEAAAEEPALLESRARQALQELCEISGDPIGDPLRE